MEGHVKVETPKTRFEKAMRHQKPEDYVAFMEIEFHIFEEYTGKKPVFCSELEKLTNEEKEAAFHKNAEILIETAEKAGHDCIRPPYDYWEVSPGVPSAYWIRGMDDIVAQIRALKKLAGDRFFILGTVAANIGIPEGSRMMAYVEDLYERPDEVHRRCEKTLQYSLSVQQRQLEAGADGIISCVDVAFNTGPFISPAMMDEFFFPYFHRWVDSLKSQGILSIWHTDGDISILLERAISCGVDAIQCVDPLANMDIVALKKTLGDRLTLIGNIDCSLLNLGKPDQVDAQVRHVVEGCKGSGGFVLSGCNAIFHGIPAENYQAMVDARYKYGREKE